MISRSVLSILPHVLIWLISQTFGVVKDGEDVGLITWAMLAVLSNLVGLMVTWGVLLDRLGKKLASNPRPLKIVDGEFNRLSP